MSASVRNRGWPVYAQPDGRPHTDARGVPQDQLQLRIFFDHWNDVPPDLLGQHRHLDVFVVLEAIADDRRLVVRHGHDGHQLRLRAGFQAESEGTAEFQNLFDHLALLVHLDRVNAAVVALVTVFGDGGRKGAVHFAQAMLQDSREPDQDRQGDASQHQGIDQLFQVNDRCGSLSGCNAQVAVAIHQKVALAPTGDIVEFAGVCGVQRSAGSMTREPFLAFLSNCSSKAPVS